ncbi:hypothetical protein BGZ76_000957 [Entomortierella beljakovae]|nr:hypothetical protein BGZ76_000957 [Entomortierella beljakovae]
MLFMQWYITYNFPIKWHPTPPPVLQHPCIVIDSEKNITYIIGNDSKGDIVFNFVDQTTCSANWGGVTWTSLPKPGGSKLYHTAQCFLTSTHHFAVQYEGGIAIWDHWARIWTLRDIPCSVTYPNNAALVYQNAQSTIDDILIQWQDSNGAHLTAVQLINDNISSCTQLSTSNVPTDMNLAASPNNGKVFFLFGPKSSCWYDITVTTTPATSPSQQVVQTNGECQSMAPLSISVPRATNFGSSVWIFGKNNVGVGVWSVDTTASPYAITPRSQGAPIDGDFTIANCGTGIIVYGGCSTPDRCSTSLQPGESIPPGTSIPPFSIFIPPGSWTPPLPAGIPAGIPSGGPNVPIPTGPSGVTSGPNATPTAPGVLPPGVLPPGGGDNNGSKTSGSKHTGAITGAVIGSLSLLFMVALIFLVARKRRKYEDNYSGGGDGTTVAVVDGVRIFTSKGLDGRYIETHVAPNGTSHYLFGVPPGATKTRTITRRTENGEMFLVPADGPDYHEREITDGSYVDREYRYIIGRIISIDGVAIPRTSLEAYPPEITSKTRIVTRTRNDETVHEIVGGFRGNAIRVVASGNTFHLAREPEGEMHYVFIERDDDTESMIEVVRYYVGDVISNRAYRVTSIPLIVIEPTVPGETDKPRHIIVGEFNGTTIRVLTKQISANGINETHYIPTNNKSGKLYYVVIERLKSGEIIRSIGDAVKDNEEEKTLVLGCRIATIREPGELSHVIVDKYYGNTIRTKYDHDEEADEFVHTLVRKPEGEIRQVRKEKTKDGAERKVVGPIIPSKRKSKKPNSPKKS